MRMDRIRISKALYWLKEHGFRYEVHDGRLWIEPWEQLSQEQQEWLVKYEEAVVDEIQQQRRENNRFAVLMSLVDDGFRFWLAPDGLDFDPGDIPVIRRSVMDKLKSEANGSITKQQLETVIQSLKTLGGDLSVVPPVPSDSVPDQPQNTGGSGDSGENQEETSTYAVPQRQGQPGTAGTGTGGQE